jgi:hypothetical protein
MNWTIPLHLQLELQASSEQVHFVVMTQAAAEAF